MKTAPFLGTFLACLLLLSCNKDNSNSPAGSGWIEIPQDQRDYWYAGIGYQKGWTTPAISENKAYHIDPNKGSMDGDGSADFPWLSLQAVIDSGWIAGWDAPESNPARQIKNPNAPVQAGDVLILYDGYHGEFNVRNHYNERPITIKAQTGHQPALKKVRLWDAENWRFDGLYLSYTHSQEPEHYPLIDLDFHEGYGHCKDVEIYNCIIYSALETRHWTADDWNAHAVNGIDVEGEQIRIENNYLLNINFGIGASGNHISVKNNTVKNFSGDGLRGIGSDLLFEANLVKNCYAVNGNHDDGFQSWSINDQPDRERVVLRRNVILNHEDPDQPHKGSLQGIGCFDGFFNDWTIENNLVVVDHWHGISLYGARRSIIQNNIVVDINDERPGPAWIMFHAHKDGRPNVDCQVLNNICTDEGSDEVGVTIGNNRQVSIDDYSSLFEDHESLDFRLMDPSILTK